MIIEFPTKCDKCNAVWDAREGEFAASWHGKTLKLCRDCYSKFGKANNFWFAPHVPAFVEGATRTLSIFDSQEELLDFLKKIPNENEILCKGSDNEVMTINKDGKNWWVHGFVKDVNQLSSLPDWNSLRKDE